MACLAPLAAQAADDSNGTTSLPEVLVQARRVTEDQQKTPVAVTAINKDILRLDTTTEVTVLQKDVPNFQIQPNTFGGDAAPSFTIRGLSTSLLADPSVVSYVDGVVQDPRNFAYMFYDLDSAQVLKGPQGTLFGKNSTGGALLLQPVHPRTEFGPDGSTRALATSTTVSSPAPSTCRSTISCSSASPANGNSATARSRVSTRA